MATLLKRPGSGPPPRQIRFVHNQGQPQLKRRRINAACLTCRRRKTRCAGERPVCSTCTKNGHQCLGYPEDTRKSGSETRLSIDELPIISHKPHDEDDENEDDDDNEDGNANDDDDDAEDAVEGYLEEKPTRASASSDARPVSGKRSASPPHSHKTAAATVCKLATKSRESNDNAEVKMTLSPATPSQARPSADAAYPVGSPIRRPDHSHRVPYFRYFGPTAIVPGFKQMVVSVRDRRRSTGGSQSGASPLSTPSGLRGSSCAPASDVAAEDLPVYDPNSPAPVHPLIFSLVKTFFVHLGCNYPFLQEPKFLSLVFEKRVEPILVDAVCALAARFSDAPALSRGNDKMERIEWGQAFALRAKHAIVDTFPCPSVGAVQACLLMAYEGFGANQDSALWMYLGLAIRMAIDLGLQKRIGIQYQGEKDPWYTRHRSRTNEEQERLEETKTGDAEALSLREQRELEQERIDTFWAVFVLDRVISSGTGRPVTFREDDFELPFPEPTTDPTTGWPSLFPVFLQIIHLYGQVSDVLNNLHNICDLTQDKWSKLANLEQQLTRLYKSWDPSLQFNVCNFKAYLSVGQGTTFILLHFWFHALFIILHQPTLLTPFGDLRSELQLLPDSRELSMSSAKTICDILAFADLIDPKSFIGNPFTSQPIYIAACAFLMESSAYASRGPSREASPPTSTCRANDRRAVSKHSRHSLLASAANQNYQRCYSSLQQLHTYWGGVKYILTALDQKSKGIWDCETYTSEEYESTRLPARSGVGEDSKPSSPMLGAPPPIAWSLAGTANSPNSNLTLMYQSRNPNMVPPTLSFSRGGPASVASLSLRGAMCGPMGQGASAEAGSLYGPTIRPIELSATCRSPAGATTSSTLPSSAGATFPSPLPGYDSLVEVAEGSRTTMPSSNAASCNRSGRPYVAYGPSPVGAVADTGAGSLESNNTLAESHHDHVYLSHGRSHDSLWGFGAENMDSITFDSQDIDIGVLGLQQPDLMSGWLDYIPSDVLGLLDNHDTGQGGRGGQVGS